eukprot:2441428-Pyramimonas_sp.AAC.1
MTQAAPLGSRSQAFPAETNRQQQRGDPWQAHATCGRLLQYGVALWQAKMRRAIYTCPLDTGGDLHTDAGKMPRRLMGDKWIGASSTPWAH